MKQIFIGALGLVLFGLGSAKLSAQNSLLDSATISASSVLSNTLGKVTDGDYTSQWVSTNPLPSNYITNPEQNLFLHQADSIGSGSGAGPFTRLTDGQLGLLGNIPLSNGKAWFALDYPSGQELALVSLKAKTNVDISVYAHHNGDSTLLGVYTSGNNYQLKRYLHTGPNVDRVSMQATGFFQVFEFSGMANPPKEYVEIDLGTIEDIGSIHGKHWPGTNSASASVIKSSTDGQVWTILTTLDESSSDTLTTYLPTGTQARYLRFEHTLFITDYKKVYWWEIDVFSPSTPSGGGGSAGGSGNPSSSWDSLAGVIPSYVDSAILTASSTFDQTLEDARDKDENTQWLSESPFPNNYYTRADQNNFHNLAGSNGSTSSASNLVAVTDLNGGSSADISVLGGGAWVALDFSQGETVEFINIKARADADLKIYGWQSSSDSTLLGTYSTSNNYSFQKYNMPSDSVWRISVVSTQGFDLFELAGITQNPKEWVDVDFGSAKEIGTIVTRHRSSGDHVEAIALYTSTDGQNWTHLEDLIPDALGVVSTRVDPTITAQYVRVEYTMTLQDYKKASLWEIDIYDEHGKFGQAPVAAASTVSVRELLGINTIWGWGHNQYSDLLGDGEGASLHQSHSSYARYYHNMDWDVSDPDTIVDYQAMENGQGTQALWWLDWNREYEPVIDTGLTLFNSIQFDKIDPSAWDSPYQSAYDYGYNYAAYFGSQQGNGFVNAIEIGNEPWDYEPALYRDILQGMAEGIRAADSTMQILPCALQATDPSSDLEEDNINYLGNKVLET
ncbi:MAG: discoidin domain-containing protein, partial [Bacteroidota bacterium]